MRHQARYLLTLTAFLALGACGTPDERLADDVDAGAELAPETDEARPPYADWDLDTDARLAADEFREWTRQHDFPGDWDEDGNDAIGEDEFAAGMLGVWDDDDDDRLSEAEWQDNVGDWFDEDHSTFAAWDADGNGALTRDELRQGFVETDFFGDWDLNDDDLLDENELDDGFFGLFDENDSGYIEENEWAATDHWTMTM